jgi:hypothetical protein
MHMLPTVQVPPRFQDRLAQRLSERPSEPPALSVLIRAREWVRINVLWGTGRVLRPALALGAVAIACLVGNIHAPSVTTVSHTTIATAPAPVDSKLISECVAQHQNAVASEPLTDDWAAANLAQQMDDAQPAGDNSAADSGSGS